MPGKVEVADKGTLFLDEIGDLPLEIQGKLLRFLQDRAFERVGGRQTMSADVRIVCATHRDLKKLVSQRSFREDLYYRVKVVEIELPPLRARGSDEIEALARHFADIYSARYERPRVTFTTEALERLRTHRWPGNVRELEHWVESAIVLAPDGVIDAASFPAPDSGSPSSLAKINVPDGLSLDAASRIYAQATVDQCGGNKTEAAKRLGIGRNTLARVLKG